MTENNDYVVPGEYKFADEPVELNAGRRKITIRVSNTGDRPIQVGSHIHFVETNPYLSFDRKQAVGMRLNIPAGTAVRFEPGQEMEVELTELGGNKHVYGIANLTDGPVERVDEILEKARRLEYKGVD